MFFDKIEKKHWIEILSFFYDQPDQQTKISAVESIDNANICSFFRFSQRLKASFYFEFVRNCCLFVADSDWHFFVSWQSARHHFTPVRWCFFHFIFYMCTLHVFLTYSFASFTTVALCSDRTKLCLLISCVRSALLVWAWAGLYAGHRHEALGYAVQTNAHRACFTFVSMMLLLAQTFEHGPLESTTVFLALSSPFFFGHVMASIWSCYAQDKQTDTLLAQDAQTAARSPTVPRADTASDGDVAPSKLDSLQEV